MTAVGLAPIVAVILWLATTATPITTGGCAAIGLLAAAGTRSLGGWSAWLAAPGALLVAWTAPSREDYVVFLVAVFVWRGAVSCSRLDHELEGTGAVPLLFFISAMGAYSCLADTEQVVVLAAVAFAWALAALAIRDLSFGGPGSMAIIGLTGWIAASGGIGRPAGTIGALGSLGVLLVAGGMSVPRAPFVLVVPHVVCVAVCSRMAGVSGDAQLAFFVVLAALALTAVAVWLLAPEPATDTDW